MDDFVLSWNLHHLRRSRNEQLAFGRPLSMFSMPEQFGTKDYICHVDDDIIEACKNECVFKTDIPCDQDVYDFCTSTMVENMWAKPNDPKSARELYINLHREAFNHIMY